MKQLNTHEMTQTFTNSRFELDSFKELLTRIFPNIFFLQTPQTRVLRDSKLLKTYTEICKPVDVGGGLQLGVGVFECDSIHAKIGIHTELKNALKNSPFSALLCVFYSKKAE